MYNLFYFTGLLCLVIYYRFFHPIGPIRMFIKDEPGELEKGGKEADNSHTLDSNANSTFRESTRRNIKYMYATATQKTVKWYVLLLLNFLSFLLFLLLNT